MAREIEHRKGSVTLKGGIQKEIDIKVIRDIRENGQVDVTIEVPKLGSKASPANDKKVGEDGQRHL